VWVECVCVGGGEGYVCVHGVCVWSVYVCVCVGVECVCVWSVYVCVCRCGVCV